MQGQGESSPLLLHLGIDRKKQVGEGPPLVGANAGHPGSIPGLGAFHVLRNSCAPLRRSY